MSISTGTGFFRTFDDDYIVCCFLHGVALHEYEDRATAYLRERYLSHRLLGDYDAVVQACCRAWNALTQEVGRIKSLCAYPYIKGISS